MKAIILAAGRSTRLYPLTLDQPKCLLPVGKFTIIEYQKALLNRCGISDILVVTGYLNDHIEKVLKDTVRYKYYKDYAKTNNLFTLHSVKEELSENVLILFSDVILSEKLLKRCVDSNKDFRLIVDQKNVTDKTMRVKIKNGSIYNIGSHIPVEEGDGNFIGIAGFSKKAAGLLAEEIEKLVKNQNHVNDYYTYALINIAFKKNPIGFVDASNEPWIEIDYKEDYDRALKEFGDIY